MSQRASLQLPNLLATVRGAFENSDESAGIESAATQLINDALVESYDIGISRVEDYNTGAIPEQPDRRACSAFMPVTTDFYKLSASRSSVATHVDEVDEATSELTLSSSNLSYRTRRLRTSAFPAGYRLQGGYALIVADCPIRRAIRCEFGTSRLRATRGRRIRCNSTFHASRSFRAEHRIRDCLVRQDLDSPRIDREIERAKCAQPRSRHPDNRDSAEQAFYLSDRP